MSKNASAISKALRSSKIRKVFGATKQAKNPYARLKVLDGNYVAQLKRAVFGEVGKGEKQCFAMTFSYKLLADTDGNTVQENEETGDEITISGVGCTQQFRLTETEKRSMEEATEQMWFALQALGLDTSVMAIDQDQYDEDPDAYAGTFASYLDAVNEQGFYVIVNVNTSGQYRNVNLRQAISEAEAEEMLGGSLADFLSASSSVEDEDEDGEDTGEAEEAGEYEEEGETEAEESETEAEGEEGEEEYEEETEAEAEAEAEYEEEAEAEEEEYVPVKVQPKKKASVKHIPAKAPVKKAAAKKAPVPAKKVTLKKKVRK